MDQETLVKRWHQARLMFRKKYPLKPIQISEDFAAWYVIKLLGGKRKNQSISQAAIDFMRETNTDNDLKQDAMGRVKKLKKPEIVMGKNSRVTPKYTGIDYSKFDQLQRIYVVLMFEYGFQDQEIARVLGVSSWYASQIFKSVKEVMTNKKRTKRIQQVPVEPVIREDYGFFDTFKKAIEMISK